jgi:alkaline phosphatase D
MTTRNVFSRRDFIRGLGASVLAASALARSSGALAQDVDQPFQHGVASGDPLADRVIIWTRVTPKHPGPVSVKWEVAHDAEFRQVLRRGHALAGAQADYTVKVDVLGLPPSATLFYRFSAQGQLSSVGRTRTLPVGELDQVKLAVFSCANYPAGYFHVYAEAAKLDDVFASVHLGDYIYEYGRDGYASGDAAALGREVEPANELLALNDYRQRYAQYRSDLDLQAMHAAMPMIAVWDDHEISNDTWRNGADNHDQASEGSFGVRRAAAIRAYHEWLPTRLPDPNKPDLIFRSFKFGNLLSLYMLDTRVIARDQQLDYANYLSATGFDEAQFSVDMANPDRQLIGTMQSNWLTKQMANSTATWDVLGQQVLMGRMYIPAPLVLGQISFTDYSILVYKAQTDPASLTAAELEVLSQPAIPYNLDAWDGYAMARETMLGTSLALNKNLVVLAGDTHNGWASNLDDYLGNPVGVEFATPSVSSPGLEEYFPSEDPIAVAAGLSEIIGPLQYANTHQRGFMLVTATPTECQAEWRYVDTVKSLNYSVVPGPILRTLPGAGNRRIVPAV